MKTYEEKTNSVLERVNTVKEKRSRRNKTVMRIAVPALCLCMVSAAAGTISRHNSVTLRHTGSNISSTEDIAFGTPGKTGSDMGDVQTISKDEKDIKSESSTSGVPENENVQTENSRATTDASDNTSGSASKDVSENSPPDTNTAVVGGPFLGIGDDVPKTETCVFISSYGGTGNAAEYPAPENGSCTVSKPLAAAMEDYQSSVRYNVIVKMYKDGQLLPGGSDAVKNEIQRLADLGYIMIFEEQNYGTGTRYVTYIHASMDQIKALPQGGNYGFLVHLSGEFDYGDTTENKVVNEALCFN